MILVHIPGSALACFRICFFFGVKDSAGIVHDVQEEPAVIGSKLLVTSTILEKEVFLTFLLVAACHETLLPA